jgi:hypothetical protein
MPNDNFTYIPGANEPNARANHVWDPTTETWVRDEKYKVISPMLDVDTSFVYNGDGTVQQIISQGLGQTKTSVFTYAAGILQSIAVVIT